MFARSLAPAQIVDEQTVLNALRDDSKYRIDPLTLLVTIATPGEVRMIGVGGGPFTVGADQQFAVESVKVRMGSTRSLHEVVASAIDATVVTA